MQTLSSMRLPGVSSAIRSASWVGAAKDDKLAVSFLLRVREWTKKPRLSIQILTALVADLSALYVPTTARLGVLEVLFSGVSRLIDDQLPWRLGGYKLPLSPQWRKRLDSLHEVLETLSQEYANALCLLWDDEPIHRAAPDFAVAFSALKKTAGFSSFAAKSAQSAQRAAGAQEYRLFIDGHVLCCQIWRLRLAWLAAMPAPIGVWRDVHARYRQIREAGGENYLLSTECFSISLHHLYMTALCQALANPSSMNSEGISLIARYLSTQRMPLLSTDFPGDSDRVVWVNLGRDAPPMVLRQKKLGRTKDGLYFTLDLLLADLQVHLQHHHERKTGNGVASGHVLPDDSWLPAGMTADEAWRLLEKLPVFWQGKAKRQVRVGRQQDLERLRACVGFKVVRELIETLGESSAIKTLSLPQTPCSVWRIVNQSSEGYALLLDGGATQVQVGDLMMIDAAPAENQRALQSRWNHYALAQVCWAVSENVEHVELGVKILATHAVPVSIAVAKGKARSERHEVLGLWLQYQSQFQSAGFADNVLMVAAGEGELLLTCQQLVVMHGGSSPEITVMTPRDINDAGHDIDLIAVDVMA